MNKFLVYVALLGTIVLTSCEKPEDLSDELARAEATIESQKDKIASLQQTINDLVTQGNDDVIDVSIYTAQIAELQNDIQVLNAMIEALEADDADNQARIAELENELSAANDALANAEAEIAELGDEIAGLQADLIDADITADNYLAQISALESQLENAGSEIVYVTNVVTETVEVIKEVIITETEVVTVTETEIVEVEVPVTEVVTKVVEVPVIVTEVVTVTETEVVTVTNEVVVTEVVTVTVVETEVVTVTITNEVEVTPLTFVGDGGLKLYSDSTLDSNNFVTYNLFKTASSTFIDLNDIKDMISVDTDLAYTVQVVDPVAGDNKLSVRITFTNGNPTEGIIVASISGAYYETAVPVAESNNATDTEAETEEPDNNPEPVVCSYTDQSSESKVSTTTYTEWENVGTPDVADATEQYTTQQQTRTKTEVVTTTTTTSYTKSDASCEDKDDVIVVDTVTNVTTETQEIQVANPDYEEDAVNIGGYIYQENIVSSIASVTYTPWSPWVTQGLVDVSNRTRTDFTIQTTSYLPHDANAPAVDNAVENINVVTTVETKKSVVINVHGNYERVDVGGTHGITDFKAGDVSSYNVYLNGNLNSDPLLTIALTGTSGSGSSKKNGYTLNYSFEKDAANNYFIDLSVTSDVNIHVVLNN